MNRIMFLQNVRVGVLNPNMAVLGDRAYKEVIYVKWGNKAEALIW